MPPPDAGAGDRPGLAELFAALPVAVLLIDPQDNVATASASAELLLNRSERAMLGRPLRHILPDHGARRPRQDYAAYDTEIATGQGVKLRVDLVEAQLAERPGWRLITLHAGASARRLGHSADRAAGARAAVGAAAMLAHEIKNPLSGIRGAAQLINAGELTDLIVTEVDRIAALIDGMQTFSDTRPLALEAANIYPLIGHARAVAEAGFASALLIEERFDPSLPLASVNRNALTQVLLNLLKNAAEALHGTAKPRIAITTAYRHGMAVSAGAGMRPRPLPIEICVVDNGPGAPDEIADHLFEPFVSGRGEGQGLGLALVDKLVRAMGGIAQYAREGVPEQTVLRLLLPRADG